MFVEHSGLWTEIYLKTGEWLQIKGKTFSWKHRGNLGICQPGQSDLNRQSHLQRLYHLFWKRQRKNYKKPRRQNRWETAFRAEDNFWEMLIYKRIRQFFKILKWKFWTAIHLYHYSSVNEFVRMDYWSNVKPIWSVGKVIILKNKKYRKLQTFFHHDVAL